MEHNCNFNKAALLVEISRIKWRIEQYKKDAEKAGHVHCETLLGELNDDLHKYRKKLQDAIVGLSKEEKFSFCDEC